MKHIDRYLRSRRQISYLRNLRAYTHRMSQTEERQGRFVRRPSIIIEHPSEEENNSNNEEIPNDNNSPSTSENDNLNQELSAEENSENNNLENNPQTINLEDNTAPQNEANTINNSQIEQQHSSTSNSEAEELVSIHTNPQPEPNRNIGFSDTLLSFYNDHPTPHFPRTENMALTIREICNEIPRYAGDEEGLNDFLITIDDLWVIIESAEDRIKFLQILRTRLTGEAKRAIIGNQYRNWQEMRRSIHDHLQSEDYTERLRSELESIKQNSNESTAEFAKKIEKLLRNLNDSLGNQLTPDAKRQNDKKARKVFTKGLRNEETRKIAFYGEKSTLRETISYVIEKENDLPSFSGTNSSKCEFCQIQGHTENQCRNKKKMIEEFNKRKIQRKNIPESNQNRNSNNNYGQRNNEIVCYNCNKKGHTSRDCFAPKRNQNNSNDNSNNSQNKSNNSGNAQNNSNNYANKNNENRNKTYGNRANAVVDPNEIITIAQVNYSENE